MESEKFSFERWLGGWVGRGRRLDGCNEKKNLVFLLFGSILVNRNIRLYDVVVVAEEGGGRRLVCVYYIDWQRYTSGV